jgi:hypothetical protein
VLHCYQDPHSHVTSGIGSHAWARQGTGTFASNFLGCAAGKASKAAALFPAVFACNGECESREVAKNADFEESRIPVVNSLHASSGGLGWS